MLLIILRGVMMMSIKTWKTLAALSPPVPSARSASLQRMMHYSIHQVKKNIDYVLNIFDKPGVVGIV